MPLYRVDLHREIIEYKTERFSHYVRALTEDEALASALATVVAKSDQYLDRTDFRGWDRENAIQVDATRKVDE